MSSDIGHAAIGSPSALARTVQCPGWVQLSAGLPPQPDTDEICEGRAADWVAYQYSAGVRVIAGATAPNGVTVTDEMVRGGMLWAYETQCDGALSQMPVSCAPIHPMSWGTPDKMHWDAGPRIATVWDYKFGHLLHDPYEHWQCMAYLTGLLSMHGMLGDPEVLCRVVIVQPRDYGNTVKRWQLNVGQLRAYINIAEAAVAESMTPNPRTRVGEECLYCPARHRCKTLQHAASKVMEYAGQACGVDITTDALAAEYTLLEHAQVILKARHTGIDEQIKAHWFGGTKVRGYSCEQKVGRLNWNVPAGEVIAACDAFQVDVRKSKDPATITPTQAMDRGLPEHVVKLIASRQAGEWHVVRDDPRKIQQRMVQT